MDKNKAPTPESRQSAPIVSTSIDDWASRSAMKQVYVAVSSFVAGIGVGTIVAMTIRADLSPIAIGIGLIALCVIILAMLVYWTFHLLVVRARVTLIENITLVNSSAERSARNFFFAVPVENYTPNGTGSPPTTVN